MDSKTYAFCMNKGSVSWNDLAKMLGMGENCGEKLRCAFKRERAKRVTSTTSSKLETNSKETIYKYPEKDFSDYSETYSINNDGTHTSDRLISICEADLKSPESVMKAHGFDVDKWEVIACRNNLWHSQRPNDAGRLVMYQSKVTVRPKREEEKEITFEDIDNFFKNYNGKAPSGFGQMSNYSREGKVLEIDLADLHIGKTVVPGEDEIDTPEKWSMVVSDVISRIGKVKLKKIILVNLGDIVNHDTYKQSTTDGTVVQSSMDSPTMFDAACEVAINTIKRLSLIAPVDVINIVGNHDRITCYMVFKAVQFFFRNNPNVTVDTDHAIRKYRKIGCSLVGWAHGDLQKKNVSTLLQREARKEFGETKYAELHLGHVHHEMSEDKDGVIVRYLPTVTSPDDWHVTQGYTGNKKSSVCFLWDLEAGLQEIWYTNF